MAISDATNTSVELYTWSSHRRGVTWKDGKKWKCIEGAYLLPLVTLPNLRRKPQSICATLTIERDVLANSIEFYEILQNSSPNQVTVQLQKS
jgi:hypothetical protein